MGWKEKTKKQKEVEKLVIVDHVRGKLPDIGDDEQYDQRDSQRFDPTRAKYKT